LEAEVLGQKPSQSRCEDHPGIQWKGLHLLLVYPGAILWHVSEL